MPKKKTATTAVVETKQSSRAVAENASVDSLLAEAVKSGASVETMERLMALRKELKAEQAKEMFVQSLANFQKDCPVIKKTKPVYNKDGRTVRYKYAPIDSVIEQIKDALVMNDLSYSWDSTHSEGHIKVTAKLTHIMGHSETSSIEIPITKSEFMTSPQSYATAQSYAKRYTLLNVLGIGTADEDTDAIDTGKDKTAKAEKAKIMFLLRTLKYPHASKEEVEESVQKIAKLKLTEKNYPEIIQRLEVTVSEANEA